jgi:NAD(P)-dependent dehydrogenase (short-subunit alcohol dehydrogenase family)
MGTLDGKVAIVTGASRGIGRAIAEHLASEGARVVLIARDKSLLEDAIAEIRARGGTAECLSLDLRDEAAAEEAVAFALGQYGDLDILVNNAGATKRGAFLELPDADWQDGFALKFFGAMRLTRAAWPSLKARGGSVVSIAGIGGRTPGPEFSIGGSVNAALLALTKSLADLGVRDGVQVNAINPGAVRTDRLNRRLEAEAQAHGGDKAAAEAAFVREAAIIRIGEPKDIAAFVAFLVSPDGRFFQGALLDIDGGQTKTL